MAQKTNRPGVTTARAGLVPKLSGVSTEFFNGVGGYSTPAGTGDVVGPGSATDNAIARFDGTTGKLIQNSAVTVDDTGVLGFPDGVRQTFNPNGTNAGLNVGSQAGDPSSLSNGDLWYNSSSNKLFARINGLTVEIGANAGADYVVMSDGANPPTPMDDGAGNFLYVAYTP